MLEKCGFIHAKKNLDTTDLSALGGGPVKMDALLKLEDLYVEHHVKHGGYDHAKVRLGSRWWCLIIT